MSKINIVLADDHVLVRNGIKAMLESEADIKVIGEAGNGAEALERAKSLRPDILVLDIRMPEMSGLEAAEISHRSFPLVLARYSSTSLALRMRSGGAA